MTVEIKQSDSPEEKEKKLRTFSEYLQKKSDEEEVERRREIRKFFGAIKSNADPLALQLKMRNEWD